MLKVLVSFVIFLLTTIILQMLYSTTPHQTISMPEVMPQFVQKTRLINNLTTVVSTLVFAHHCQFVLDRQRQKARLINRSKLTSVNIPHWLERMNGTSSYALNSTELTNDNMYLMTMNNGGRLGNQMLSYAALFGIAWGHRRIPLWQKSRMQLQTFFNTSIHQETFQVCQTFKTIDLYPCSLHVYIDLTSCSQSYTLTRY